MRSSKFRKTRPLLRYGVLAFTLASAPAFAMGGGGPPLASGPDRATSGSYGNYSSGPSSGGYGGADRGPHGKRWDCKFYNPYVPFQNQQYCQ